MIEPERVFNAWRFVHPDLDAAGRGAGLQIGVRGGIEMAAGRESVRQALLLLLSTRRGERVMRPDYGCDLHRLLFSPNDDTTAGLAIHYVRRAIDRWEPRVEILSLDAGPDHEVAHILTIYLEYRIRALQTDDALLFSLSLTGEQG